MPPILKTTERLSLLELDESYLDVVMRLMSDPSVNEFFYGFQNLRTNAELRSYTSEYFFPPFSKTNAEFGFGGMAIHERASANTDVGDFVGITGFFPPPVHHQEFGPELIYVLGSAYHGRGCALEAAKAAIEYAQSMKDIVSLSLTTDAPNIGSRRVAEKLGFSEFGEIEAYGAEDMVFYTKNLR